jgi:hypothetical protein
MQSPNADIAGTGLVRGAAGLPTPVSIPGGEVVEDATDYVRSARRLRARA